VSPLTQKTAPTRLALAGLPTTGRSATSTPRNGRGPAFRSHPRHVRQAYPAIRPPSIAGFGGEPGCHRAPRDCTYTLYEHPRAVNTFSALQTEIRPVRSHATRKSPLSLHTGRLPPPVEGGLGGSRGLGVRVGAGIRSSAFLPILPSSAPMATSARAMTVTSAAAPEKVTALRRITTDGSEAFPM
jgi:hypothetical protein